MGKHTICYITLPISTIGNIARYPGNVSILTCLLANRKWLQIGSCSYIAQEKNVTDKNLLKDLHYLFDFSHIGNLEVYHSLCNKFSPKRLCMYAWNYN